MPQTPASAASPASLALVQAILFGLLRLAAFGGGLLLAMKSESREAGAALIAVALTGSIGDKLVVARKVDEALMTPPPDASK